MHVLVVHAHPEPSSFNAALCRVSADTVAGAGHSVEVSDLYAEKFDPVAGRHDFREVAGPSRFHYQTEQEHAVRGGGFSDAIAREQDRLVRADVLILHYPLWWGGAPAILKGWFDRVLAYGFAYADGRRFDAGVFKGRRAIVCVTTGGPQMRFMDGDVYGEVGRVLWQVQRLTLQYVGYEVAPPMVCYGTPRVEPAVRERYLAEWRGRVVKILAHPVAHAEIAPALEGLSAGAWSRKA